MNGAWNDSQSVVFAFNYNSALKNAFVQRREIDGIIKFEDAVSIREEDKDKHYILLFKKADAERLREVLNQAAPGDRAGKLVAFGGNEGVDVANLNAIADGHYLFYNKEMNRLPDGLTFAGLTDGYQMF